GGVLAIRDLSGETGRGPPPPHPRTRRHLRSANRPVIYATALCVPDRVWAGHSIAARDYDRVFPRLLVLRQFRLSPVSTPSISICSSAGWLFSATALAAPCIPQRFCSSRCSARFWPPRRHSDLCAAAPPLPVRQLDSDAGRRPCPAVRLRNPARALHAERRAVHDSHRGCSGYRSLAPGPFHPGMYRGWAASRCSSHHPDRRTADDRHLRARRPCLECELS